MARKVFESPDLLRQIYSFGYPEHRTFTKHLQTEIQSKAQEFVEHFQRTRDGSDIVSYVLGQSIDTIENELITYKRCFCCARHNNDKPILTCCAYILTRSSYFMRTGPSVFENTITECHCPCRSLSRTFIRNFRKLA